MEEELAVRIQERKLPCVERVRILKMLKDKMTCKMTRNMCRKLRKGKMEHHTLRAQLEPEKQFHESEFIGNETDIKKL